MGLTNLLIDTKLNIIDHSTCTNVEIERRGFSPTF